MKGFTALGFLHDVGFLSTYYAPARLHRLPCYCYVTGVLILQRCVIPLLRLSPKGPDFAEVFCLAVPHFQNAHMQEVELLFTFSRIMARNWSDSGRIRVSNEYISA